MSLEHFVDPGGRHCPFQRQTCHDAGRCLPLEARQNCIPHRLTLPLDHRESLRKHLERAGPEVFCRLESTRQVKGLQTTEYRCYISSLPADAQRLAQAIRAHWSVENPLHWCMDVAFGDEQMRARTQYAAHNLAVLKQLVLNLSRLDPTGKKGGIKTRGLVASTSDTYRAALLGLG
ncbi:ISAs1 family transposase [Azotobacter chroococcum]|uniref:ISAs1 family transposase n=1 Tax=Azotobacter chroococcum TaxID=353 RepID=UPI0030B86E78